MGAATGGLADGWVVDWWWVTEEGRAKSLSGGFSRLGAGGTRAGTFSPVIDFGFERRGHRVWADVCATAGGPVLFLLLRIYKLLNTISEPQ